MRASTVHTALALLVAAAAFGALNAGAMRLDPEGGGQALIYPYYTVRSYGTDSFNTYISIVNAGAEGKALRVRFREGREGLEALGFNLFLSPNDTWTGALIPSADGGTQLITADKSCIAPAMASLGGGLHGRSLSAAAFSADGVDRTREGYVEVLEMATLKGDALAAVLQDASGVPHDCGAVQDDLDSSVVAAPSGGLQGTVTWINVASGMDFNLDAEPIADLATAAYFRPPANEYPDFDAREILAQSEISDGTYLYRLSMSSPVDALSTLFMRTAVRNEYVLDRATNSSTDWVVTFPTRRFQVKGTQAGAPFSAATPYTVAGCEIFTFAAYNREGLGLERSACGGSDGPACPPALAACRAANAWPWVYGSASPPAPPIFGSNASPSYLVAGTTAPATLPLPFLNGSLAASFTGTGPATGLTSLPSRRMSLVTGTVEQGTFRIQGLPLLGFMARTFINGSLPCNVGTCQGSYGNAFPHHGVRTIGPAS